MGLTVIHSVLLFDGTSIHQNATVIFNSNAGTITSVGSGPPDTSVEATFIDGSGCTLLPGLIDSHIHCDGISLPQGADDSDILRAPLRCGITTVCDMHSDPLAVKKWREKNTAEETKAKISGGKISLADLKSALRAATIKDGYPKALLLGENPSQEVSQPSHVYLLCNFCAGWKVYLTGTS
jgi:dihydroorotase-like cyclic amidohydrolase